MISSAVASNIGHYFADNFAVNTVAGIVEGNFVDNSVDTVVEVAAGIVVDNSGDCFAGIVVVDIDTAVDIAGNNCNKDCTAASGIDISAAVAEASLASAVIA